MPDRRRFLQSLSTLPLVGGLFPDWAAAFQPARSQRDFLKELGVRPIINAAGTYTMFTASLMWPECVRAIEATSGKFVRLTELSEAVGARIATDARMRGRPGDVGRGGGADARHRRHHDRDGP